MFSAFESSFPRSRRENESLQIRFSNNSRWKLYINDYSKLKQSAIICRSFSLRDFSNSQFQLSYHFHDEC